MEKIHLKIEGDGTAFNPKAARFVLGDHGISENGDHYLSPSCASLAEVEEQAVLLKGLIDKAVIKARREFAS